MNISLDSLSRRLEIAKTIAENTNGDWIFDSDNLSIYKYDEDGNCVTVFLENGTIICTDKKANYTSSFILNMQRRDNNIGKQ